MSKLYVIGSCYSEREDTAKDLFKVLMDAGYTLAYSPTSNTSCTILKEVEEEEEVTE